MVGWLLATSFLSLLYVTPHGVSCLVTETHIAQLPLILCSGSEASKRDDNETFNTWRNSLLMVGATLLETSLRTMGPSHWPWNPTNWEKAYSSPSYQPGLGLCTQPPMTRQRIFMQAGRIGVTGAMWSSAGESFNHRYCPSKSKFLRGQIISAAWAGTLYNAVGAEPPARQEARFPLPKGTGDPCGTFSPWPACWPIMLFWN